MVIRPHAGSAGTVQMASAAMPLGKRIDGLSLPEGPNHEGLWWQWQTLPGQGPQWVPIGKAQAPQVDLLGLDAGPQKPTEVVPLAAQRGSVPLCPQAKAGPPQAGPPAAWAKLPQSEPTPQRQHQPPPPPGPPPPKHQQPPLQEGPGQLQVHSFVEALEELQRQQNALNQQQSALQQQAVALQQAAMSQLPQQPRPQQQHPPMPQPQAAMQEPVPMQGGMQHPVPMQQAAVQQELGSTMQLPTVLPAPAMWAQGQGAANGTAAGASGSAFPYSATSVPASSSAHAAIGIAGASSGKGPSAPPRTPEVCAWQWPENFHKLQEELVGAQAFFHASVHNVGITLQNKADC